jgi:hypothetical protein
LRRSSNKPPAFPEIISFDHQIVDQILVQNNYACRGTVDIEVGYPAA